MTAGTAYVYVIFRLDGSPCYVGKGVGHRWLKHQSGSHNGFLARLVREARAVGKRLPIVKIRENLTHEQAIEIEAALIKAIGRRCDRGPLLNRTLGGEGLYGYEHTPETRAKMSASGKARPRITEAQKAAMSIGARNRKREPHYSDEHRDAIRRGVSEYWERWRTDLVVRASRDTKNRKSAPPRTEAQGIAIGLRMREYWRRVHDVAVGDDIQ